MVLLVVVLYPNQIAWKIISWILDGNAYFRNSCTILGMDKRFDQYKRMVENVMKGS
jgi:hypothetical protein